jgi:hypothetical protein
LSDLAARFFRARIYARHREWKRRSTPEISCAEIGALRYRVAMTTKKNKEAARGKMLDETSASSDAARACSTLSGG